MASVDILESELKAMGKVVVAFSGGVDSSFLAFMANRVLGTENALAVTAVSPSLGEEELEYCRRLALLWGLRWRAEPTFEMEDPRYVANDLFRCYYCKLELMSVLSRIARDERATVVLGTNLDDLKEHRPGQRAALEGGARFPLVDAAFTKADVRTISRELGLEVWNKPAAACLASRVPHDTPVTVEILSSVHKAEHALKSLGFQQVRVRHHGELARLELPAEELEMAVRRRMEIVRSIRDAGYSYVTLDLQGYRSGSLDEPFLRRGENISQSRQEAVLLKESSPTEQKG